MSHYARNHLQDDWASHAHADMEQRLEAAERQASWYFDRATKREKAVFDTTMQALFGTTGPRANRARERARTRWCDATAEARMLHESTVECLLASGEVSAELDEQWTALFDRDESAEATAG
jgi:hypothetical protein